MENYICPCCGWKLEYSESMADNILKIVCEYYHVDVSYAKTHFSVNGIAGRARIMSAYFIRKMTGETFKVISFYFNTPLGRSGLMYSNAIQYIQSRETHMKEAREIQKIIIQSLNYD